MLDVERRILDIELFTNSTLSYVVLLLFIYLVKINLINFFLKFTLLSHQGNIDYNYLS